MKFICSPPLILFCLGIASLSQAMECPLLMVARHDAPVEQLTQKEIRRLFLGVAHKTPSGQLQPIRNTSDHMLQEVFLQKIMFMSKNTYHRALANHLVRKRKAGPTKYPDIDKLIKALQDNSKLISYIWKTNLPADGTLKILLSIPCKNN